MIRKNIFCVFIWNYSVLLLMIIHEAIDANKYITEGAF